MVASGAAACPSESGWPIALSHFEACSAGCTNRSPRDAALHTYLQQVAGASRVVFETALERVALHEGLPLPA